MEITLVMDTFQKQQNNLCFKILRLFQLLVYSDTYIYEQILNIDKTFNLLVEQSMNLNILHIPVE